MTFLLATSTVSDGNMSRVLGPEEEVAENRRRFLAKNGFPENYAYADLEHGDTVAVVGDEQKGESIKADALVTSGVGVPLMLITADCFPVAYHDPEHGIVALAHLGWKSAALGLAGKVLQKMQTFGSRPEAVHVFIGPGIHKESYLTERPEQMNDPRWKSFLTPAETGLTRVDLLGFIVHALHEEGILSGNMQLLSLDTVRSEEYFSHVRSKRTGEEEGRFATVVMRT